MGIKGEVLKKFVSWRLKPRSGYYLLVFLSMLTGFLAGIAAAIIKHSVKFIENMIDRGIPDNVTNYLYFIYPFIGIALAVLFMHFILRQPVNHGIPSLLYAISKNSGYMKPHNLYSSIVTSALTVGFGGSVGLEGPTVATGGAIGATLGNFFKLDYRERILLLGAAAAGAMSAIFKAPMAGVVFALEVIMIDLTTLSIIPILLASATASFTSFLLMGTNVLYPFELQDMFHLDQVPYFIFLGVLTGLVAVYFTNMYIWIEEFFHSLPNKWVRLLVGGAILGVLIYLFPALYGEGYYTINSALHGDYSYLFNNSIFYNLQGNFGVVILLILALVLLKVVATATTFGAGGIGGIFAPTLFMGANTGLLIALIFNFLGYDISTSNSALVAMSGTIAGVLLAPLTGVFLISEITHGYELLMPLLITSTISYITARLFITNNVYSIQLAKRGELLTHNADKNMLYMIKIRDLIETDFIPVHPEDTLGDLVKAVAESHRNLFPVVDDDGHFMGLVTLDRIRKIMFKPELYDKIKVRDLMFVPDVVARVDESAESVAEKLQKGSRFNIVVLDEENRYLGFISRANLFSRYRSLLRTFSAD